MLGSEMNPLGKNDILREGVDVMMILLVIGDLASILVFESALELCMKNFVSR